MSNKISLKILNLKNTIRNIIQIRSREIRLNVGSTMKCLTSIQVKQRPNLCILCVNFHIYLNFTFFLRRKKIYKTKWNNCGAANNHLWVEVFTALYHPLFCTMYKCQWDRQYIIYIYNSKLQTYTYCTYKVKGIIERYKQMSTTGFGSSDT